MRVRGLHAQNQAVEQAHAGQRIALNIVGDAQKEAVHRGDWLLSSPPPEPAERVIVELQCHTPFSQWQPLHIHHAASHITGRVSLLEGNWRSWCWILRCGWRITTGWCSAISLLA